MYASYLQNVFDVLGLMTSAAQEFSRPLLLLHPFSHFGSKNVTSGAFTPTFRQEVGQVLCCVCVTPVSIATAGRKRL